LLRKASDKYPAYELDESNNLKPEYDADHVLLGGKRRMPTHAEQQELIDNCTSTWTNIKGVYGMLFTSNKIGYTDKSIFLPAAGFGDASYLSSAGSSGGYWSSTLANGYLARGLSFNSGHGYTNYIGRSGGHPIRPITE